MERMSIHHPNNKLLAFIRAGALLLVLSGYGCIPNGTHQVVVHPKDQTLPPGVEFALKLMQPGPGYRFVPGIRRPMVLATPALTSPRPMTTGIDKLHFADVARGWLSKIRMPALLGAPMAISPNDRLAASYVSVVLFDVNGFKAINDKQGHAAGDGVLRRTAGALRAAVRKGDQIGRYGGDEFLLVAHGRIPSGNMLPRRAAEMVMEECGLPPAEATELAESLNHGENMSR